MRLEITFKVIVPDYDSIDPNLLVKMCDDLKKATQDDKTEVYVGPISVEAEE